MSAMTHGRLGSRLRHRPCVVVVLVTVGLALALSACSGGDDSKPAAGSKGQSSPGSTAAAPTTAKPTEAKPNKNGSCNPAQLVAGQEASGVTASLAAKSVFSLLNNSDAACTMEGYPGLQLVDADGTDIPTTVVQGGGETPADLTASEVTVKPGEKASFFASWITIPGVGETNCPNAAKVEITPPGAAKAVSLDTSMTVCMQGTITVSAMQSGVTAG